MSDDGVFKKPKSVRGPNGQFISTKKPHEDKPTPQVTSELLPSALVFFDDRAYYGEKIRRTYKNNLWFFVIEDMLPLAQITEPVITMEAFTKTPYYKNALDTDIFLVDMPKTGIGLSALTLCTEKAVLEFIKTLRALGHLFPGRFPEWIHETAQLDYEEVQLLRNQQLASDPN